MDGNDRSGGESVGLRLGGQRQQLVLAMLLAGANTVVSTDTLVDGLWGDSPPSAGRHTVQGYVSELRKLLGPVIERDGIGYVVRVDESSLDSLEFESLLASGRSQLADDPEAAAIALHAALQLWRGPPFAALEDTEVLLAERARLELVTVVHLAGSASDWTLDNEYLGHLAEPGEDTAWLTRWRDFVDAGIAVAAGVDAPWMFRDLALEPGVGTPMDLVAGAMDGVGHIKPNPPEWVLDQTMTAEHALHVLPRNADAVSDSEHRGRLVPGSYADITILSGDITAGTPAEIRRLEVVATIVGGIAEFCTDPAICP